MLGGAAGCTVFAPLAFAGPCPPLTAGLPYTFKTKDVAFVNNTGSGTLVSCAVVFNGALAVAGDLGVLGGNACFPNTVISNPGLSGQPLFLRAVDSLFGMAYLGGLSGCPVS